MTHFGNLFELHLSKRRTERILPVLEVSNLYKSAAGTLVSNCIDSSESLCEITYV